MLDGIAPEAGAGTLNGEEIAVRSGHDRAPPSLRRFALEVTVRPSFASYHHFSVVEALAAAVRRIGAGLNG